MIAALDSAYAPSAAQAQAAKAAGVGLWNGYAATKGRVGIYHAWSQADFDNARLCGGTPIAYVSGWDDPVALKALAAAWNVRLCLDVEAGIRDDGPWVQGFLDASGAGLYGNLRIHLGRRAPFHVLSWYVSDPQATWGGSAPPGTPCGWQWQNSHDEFGVTVDRCWFDDWFKGEDIVDYTRYSKGAGDNGEQGFLDRIDAIYNYVKDLDVNQVAAIEAEVAKLKVAGATADPTAAAAIARIEAALKQA
jgi:hypothetical protein